METKAESANPFCASKYHVDSRLTAKVKRFALSALNADLVGIANIERFEPK